MSNYKWDSPFEWLMEKARDWSREDLQDALSTVARDCDSDMLQDIFQEEMDRDGYFTQMKQ